MIPPELPSHRGSVGEVPRVLRRTDKIRQKTVTSTWHGCAAVDMIGHVPWRQATLALIVPVANSLPLRRHARHASSSMSGIPRRNEVPTKLRSRTTSRRLQVQRAATTLSAAASRAAITSAPFHCVVPMHVSRHLHLYPGGRASFTTSQVFCAGSSAWYAEQAQA